MVLVSSITSRVRVQVFDSVACKAESFSQTVVWFLAAGRYEGRIWPAATAEGDGGLLALVGVLEDDSFPFLWRHQDHLISRTESFDAAEGTAEAERRCDSLSGHGVDALENHERRWISGQELRQGPYVDLSLRGADTQDWHEVESRGIARQESDAACDPGVDADDHWYHLPHDLLKNFSSWAFIITAGGFTASSLTAIGFTAGSLTTLCFSIEFPENLHNRIAR
jgi:hypothetical protein